MTDSGEFTSDSNVVRYSIINKEWLGEELFMTIRQRENVAYDDGKKQSTESREIKVRKELEEKLVHFPIEETGQISDVVARFLHHLRPAN